MGNQRGLQVTLVTGRTIDQGVGKEQGKNSKEYFENVAVCFIDPQDLRKLGMKEKANVQVSTKYGSVVVKALRSARTPHPGTVYVPYGLWANVVVDTETHGTGMPSLKGICAKIEPADDKPVLSIGELLKQQFGKK